MKWMDRTKNWFRIALAAASVAASAIAGAQTIPIEDFVKQAQVSQVSMSPNGKVLAAVMPLNGRRALFMIDLETKKPNIVAGYRDADIVGVVWVNNSRVLYSLLDYKVGLRDQKGSGLFAVDVDGKNARVIAPRTNVDTRGVNFVWRYPQLAGVIREEGETDDIYVAAGERDIHSPDLYRYNTRTGEKTILTYENPGNSYNYLIHNKIPRVAVGGDAKLNKAFVRVRDDKDAPWREVARWDSESSTVPMSPIRFDADGTLFVASNEGRDTMAIFKWDWAANKLGERVAGHGRYDLSDGLIYDWFKKKIVGLAANLDQPQTVWFDEEWAGLQATIDRALPNRVNALSRQGGERVLVTSYTDRSPPTWYLYDPAKKQIEEVASAAPWLKEAQLSEQKFVQYKARDGLLIPAYVTLPKGKEAKNLPLVVLIHGGPFVRGESFGYDRQAQFLASRGYAVLQADFRGSQGYGIKHYTGGWKQWGQAMQNDLTDGAMFLVNDGTVDKNRMCLMGGSYGGYATMQGLVNEPDLWKCGINIVGVTDLIGLQTDTWSDTNSGWDGAEAFYASKIGNRKDPQERAMLDKYSPYLNAGKIKAAVMIAHGSGDVRVPIEHAKRMRSAMRAVGQEPEWVIYEDEAHGFLKEANNLDFYGRVEKFLAKHIGK